MTIQRFSSRGWAFLLAVCFVGSAGIRPQTAFALPSGSVAVFQPAAIREAQVEKVMSVLARPEARLQLRLAGISRKELRDRVAKMDDSQLEWAAQRADQVKAGGFLGIIIALLVIAILVVILLWLLNKDVDVDVHDKH